MINYDRINMGCGNDFIKGWLNIGLFEDKEKFPYGQVVTRDNAAVMNWDLTQGLDLGRGSVKYIYASHFIEHLFITDGYRFLQNCHYLLNSEGVLRVTCPDLGLWIDQYVKKKDDYFNQYKEIFLRGDFELKTNGQVFMNTLYDWSHKWAYDYESLMDLIRRAGFIEIKQSSLHQSKIENISDIEPSQVGRVMETLYVEAIK